MKLIRRGPLARLSGWLAGLILALGAGVGVAAKGGPSGSQQAAAEDLPVCYAYGTDALGSATSAAISSFPEDDVNVGNPEFDAGLAFYRECFADDFSFTLEFGGVPLLTVPDPMTVPTDPALQWANFVNDTFRGLAYTVTQHHMGSISSEINGNTGTLVSYLIATHTFGAGAGDPPGSIPPGSTAVVGGTYTDQIVKKNGRWLIKQRTLNITSNVTTLAPAP